MGRTILHADMNNFYASVECLYHPELRGKPVAVGGNAERRHGIILAKNEEAKRYGVQTGEALWQAKQKCPNIIFVPPHFDRYLKYSRLAREIYSEYTDKVEGFGLDEAWLDVSGSKELFGDGRKIADKIRERIKYELGVSVSVGVSWNKVFAKLGSDMKKPDATTCIGKKDFQKIVWPLPVEDLLYVGHATKRKMKNCGITTIGQLACADVNMLNYLFGKVGYMLWCFANGLDTSPVSNIGAKSFIKSVGNSTTAPRDLMTEEDIKIILYLLCESVAERLREYGFVASVIQISIRDNQLYSYERQKRLKYPVSNAKELFQASFRLFQINRPEKPVRSLGVRACSLSEGQYTQLSFLEDVKNTQRQEMLERTIDDIRRRFGHFSIQRGIMMTDTDLSGLDPKKEHIIHPISFL